MKTRFAKLVSILIAFSFVLGLVPASAFAASGLNGYVDTHTGKSKYVISSTDYAITKGVTETNVTLNSATGNEQTMGYMLTIDFAANPDLKLKATYGDYYKGTDPTKWSVDNWTLINTSKQAADYEKATGENVVFATNGDYFNMQTGQPSGPLVMNGISWNKQKATREPYFAVLKDGSCVFRDAGTPLDDVAEAIAGPFFLVRDGKNVATDKVGAPYPVNSVGRKADGTIVFFLADGRQYPFSVGMTQSEQADFLIAQGVVEALYLDGGGSATFMTEREGDSTQVIRNSPSDGAERSISSGILLVSTAASDGSFDHVVMTPNNDAYTPGSTVDFAFQPVDAAGNPATSDIPEGMVFALDASSLALGDITADGRFVSNGSTGTVRVNLLNGSVVVGSTTVDIQEPTEIYFEAQSANLDFGESGTLGFNVRANGRSLEYRGGEFEWTIRSTVEGVADDALGHMDGRNFVAGTGSSTLRGTVTASYTKASGEVLTATISVEVGKMPVTVMDFEPNENGRLTGAHYHWGKPGYGEYTGNVPTVNAWTNGRYTDNPEQTELNAPFTFTGNWDSRVPASDIFCANGYTFYLWPNNSITTKNAGSVTTTTAAEGGQVRFGEYALEFNYDYASYDGTSNSNFYIRYCGKDPVYIDGTPTQLGVWVYADSRAHGYFLYADVEVWNGSDYTTKNFQLQHGDGSCAYIDWEGWMYCYADVSSIATYASAEHPIAIIPGCGLFWLSYQPGKPNGSGRYAGTLYFDNYRFVYGTDLDDLDNPVVDSISINGTALSTETVVTIDNAAINLSALFHDVDGKNASGISPELTTILIDGKEVKGDGDTASVTTRLELANGIHSVQVTVGDGFGNTGSMLCYFLVEDAGAVTGTTLLLGDTTVTMGLPYTLTARTSGAVKSFDMTLLQVNSNFGQPTVAFADGWEGEMIYTTTGFKRAKIQLRANWVGEGAAPADANAATLSFAVPTTLDPEIDFFTYQVTEVNSVNNAGETSSAAYAKVKLSLSAYYTVKVGVVLAGFNSLAVVTDAEGNRVAGAEVLVNGAVAGVTDENGELVITATASMEGNTSFLIAARKGELVSFTTSVVVNAIAGPADGTPTALMSPVAADPAHEKVFTWMANAAVASDRAVVQYMLAEQFTAGGTAWSEAVGESQLHAFLTSKNAALLNTVTLTGLEAGKAYVYRVGDGSDEHWSATGTFRTRGKSFGDQLLRGGRYPDERELCRRRGVHRTAGCRRRQPACRHRVRHPDR